MLRGLLVACLAVACFAEYEIEDGVIVGSGSNFDAIVADNEFVLVEFYAPWCGHCKALAPEYAKAATELKGNDPPVVLVKIDATLPENEKFSEQYDIQGYPTLKWMVKGAALEYGGGRTASEIVAWVKKKTGPPAVAVNDVATAQQLIKENEVFVLGLFNSIDGVKATNFKTAASQVDLVFGITNNADVIKEFLSSPSDSNIVLFKKFDEGKNVYEGSFEAADIKSFVVANQLPIVVEFTDESAPKIFSGPIKTHILLFAEKAKDETKTHLESLGKAALPHKGKIIAVHVDSGLDHNLRILEFFSLKAADTPAIRLINMEGDITKYKPAANDLSAEALASFLQDYSDGKLKPHLMSEETPADWDAKPVKVLTGENFDKVAKDPKKHVLVEFYAPWCGHCKQLAPVWEKLAEKYEEHDNIVIAKMDSTANELEQVKVQSFPTIKLFLAGEEAGHVDHDGARTLKGFTDFIEAQTGVKVTLSESDMTVGEHVDEDDADDEYAYEDEPEGADDESESDEVKAPAHEDL